MPNDFDIDLIELNAGPEHDVERKARYLRALYRFHKPSVHVRNRQQTINQAEQVDQVATCNREFDRLFPGKNRHLLGNLLTNVWIEERHIRGEWYCLDNQAWFREDGSRVYD